jgi:hypothetical protein
MCNPIYHVIYLYSVRHNQYQNTRDFWRMIHMKEHVDNIVGNVFQDILSTTYEKIKHEIS